MIKAFLFDLDGTLVDTHEANYEAYRKALQEVGVDIGWDRFKTTIGKQSTEFLPFLAPGLTDDEYLQIRKSKAVHYKNFLHLTEANRPLIDFMKSVAVYYPCALVTTAQSANAMAILRHHDLENVFSTIVTAQDVLRHKPYPDGYLEALRRLGVSGEDSLAFEDSDTGKKAAEAAGISVVMVKDFAA